MKRFIEQRFFWFLVAGGGNTVATYLLYLLLLRFMSYRYAYSVTFLAGIALGYVVNAYWVFEKSPTLKSALAYPLIYLMQYIIGLALLAALVEIVGVPQAVAPLIVVMVTLPAMFMMTRFVFSSKDVHGGQIKR